MGRIVYAGKLRGYFSGFAENRIYVMSNGSYWVQSRCLHWHHNAYRPEVVITEEDGRFFLTVAGKSIEVKKTHCVADCQICGDFSGWNGYSRYELLNGQTWEQQNYTYQYCYSYQPRAIVCDIGGRYVMQVNGTSALVRRVFK